MTIDEPSGVGEPAPLCRSLGAAFARGGARYEQLRPGFPDAVIRWLLGDAPLRVADVGAGTGKLTRALLRAGHDVVAVDPSADMLAQLQRALPGVPVLVGTGEQTGLPSGRTGVEAMVYGQAWHWVEPTAGSAEAARVLPSGGVLGLVWNVMDLEVPWVAALNDAMHSAQAGSVAGRPDSATAVEAPFTLDARTDVPFVVRATAGELARLVTTRSYYLAMDDAGRADLAGRVREQVRSTFGQDEARVVELPYVTTAFRFVRA